MSYGCTMWAMRSLARWSVVVAFCSVVVFAAARPAIHAAGKAPIALAGAGSATSGLTAQPSPEDRWFVAPANAIAGAPSIKALFSTPSIGSTLSRSHTGPASTPALFAFRPPPHLRSIPLLI